ncbi:MAG: hypothetical protein MRY68_16930 [Sphingomonas aquatilis]|nr:hypothetical protein [Sphingomonas aquatilis]
MLSKIGTNTHKLPGPAIDAHQRRLNYGNVFAVSLEASFKVGTTSLMTNDAHYGDDQIMQHGGPVIDHVMTVRDPGERLYLFWRRGLAPIGVDRFLHPHEIDGVVHMIEIVDRSRTDPDRMPIFNVAARTMVRHLSSTILPRSIAKR